MLRVWCVRLNQYIVQQDSTGRMCYDVVEIVQNLVDQLGGSFLRWDESFAHFLSEAAIFFSSVQCNFKLLREFLRYFGICNLIVCGRISSSTPLSPIFGDPCPGYMKELRIQYEICGVKGSVTVSEVRGFLRKKLLIQSSPTIKPLIFAGSSMMLCPSYYLISSRGEN